MDTVPYDGHLGSFRGAIAYSNRDDGYFSGEYHKVCGVPTGFRWQCVEFARRYLLHAHGCVFGQCGRASEIFEMDEIVNVENDQKYEFVAHKNGETLRKPEAGDVIIYPYIPGITPFGHVGVISYVDDDSVGIAEQNQCFDKFEGVGENGVNQHCYGRSVKLKQLKDSGAWLVDEPDEKNIPAPLGWMVTNAPLRAKFTDPLLALDKHKNVPSQTPYWRFARGEKPWQPEATAENDVGAYLRGFPADQGNALGAMYYPRNNAGEQLVGAICGASRVVKHLLAAVLDRDGVLNDRYVELAADSFSFDEEVLPVPVRRNLIRLLQSATKEDEVNQLIASAFNVPERLVPAIRGSWVRGDSFMLGEYGFGISPTNTEAMYYLRDVNLDSPAGYVTPMLFADDFASSINHTEGFSGSGMGGDFARAFLYNSRRLTTATIYVLLDTANPKAAATANMLVERITNVAKEVETATPPRHFTVKTVLRENLRVFEPKTKEGTPTGPKGVYDKETNEKVEFVVKVLPWETVFEDKALADALTYPDLYVMDPLWTSIASTATTVPLQFLFHIFSRALELQVKDEREQGTVPASPCSTYANAEQLEEKEEVVDSYYRITKGYTAPVKASLRLPLPLVDVRLRVVEGPPNEAEENESKIAVLEAHEKTAPSEPVFMSCTGISQNFDFAAFVVREHECETGKAKNWCPGRFVF